MKLSKETKQLLENFAGINQNLLLKEGNKIATISTQKNVVASSTIAETIPSQFGIYDLSQFLSTLSLFEDAELEFSDKFILIKSAGNTIKYFGSDAEALVTPQKDISFPDADVNFKLTAATLALVKKTASVLGVPDVSFVGDSSKITAVVGDKKTQTTNSYEVDVGTTDKTFKANLKVENLKMIPGEYNVSISSKRISKFQGAGDLVYFIAVEADSTF
jgi:hypothetical protein